MVARRPVTDVQALGVLKSGKLVLAYGENGKLLVARSEDGGQAWRPAGELKAVGYSRLQADGVRITQLADGTALLALAAWRGEGIGDPEGLLYASRDEGRSWIELGNLGPRCAAANLLQLKSGELLAAITYQGTRREGDPGPDIRREELFNHVVVARSADGGKTWRDHRCVTRFKEAPGELTELSDRTVVLTYGQQNSPFGARAMVSKDGGETWDKRVYIPGILDCLGGLVQRDGPPNRSGVAWSSVALAGDVILTLYTRGSLVLTEKMITGWYKANRGPGERGKAVLSVCLKIPTGPEQAPAWRADRDDRSRRNQTATVTWTTAAGCSILST